MAKQDFEVDTDLKNISHLLFKEIDSWAPFEEIEIVETNRGYKITLVWNPFVFPPYDIGLRVGVLWTEFIAYRTTGKSIFTRPWWP
jgi:hypothetical protein